MAQKNLININDASYATEQACNVVRPAIHPGRFPLTGGSTLIEVT